MIDDAAPWKLELFRLCQEISAFYQEPNLFPGSGLDDETQQIFLVERAAFTTAMVLRKLAEAGKVSVQFLSRSIDFEKRPILDRDRAPDQMKMHRALDFYEPRGTQTRTSYGGFANLLLHSRVFLVIDDVDDAGHLYPAEFAVASDRSYRDYLAVFAVEQLVAFVHGLAADAVVQAMILRDGYGELISVGSCVHMDPDALWVYLNRQPHKQATTEIRRLIAERYFPDEVPATPEP